MKSLLASLLLVAASALSAPNPPAAAPKTLAVLYFDNNTGATEYDNLGRGMASMMISDLSAVPDVQLVEREHLQDVLKEQDTQRTRYFDQSTAVRAGKMLGAEYIVTGAFVAVEPQLRIDTRVIRVETGEIVKTAKVLGEEDKFFDLQQRLADSLVKGLSIALSPEQKDRLRAQQERNRIDNLSTVTQYSRALTSFDNGDYVDAVEKMGPVVQAAPNSLIVQLTYREMKRRATAKAKDKAKDQVKAKLGGWLRRP